MERGSCGLQSGGCDVQAPVGGEPAFRAPRSKVGVIGDQIRPAQVAAVHGRDPRQAWFGGCVSADRIVGEPRSLGDSRWRGFEDARVVAAGEPCDCLGPCIHPSAPCAIGVLQSAASSALSTGFAGVGVAVLGGCCRLRRSSASPAAGKITTDSSPAAIRPAAVGFVITPICCPIMRRGDDERQRGGLQQPGDRSLRAPDLGRVEQRRQPANQEQRKQEQRAPARPSKRSRTARSGRTAGRWSTKNTGMNSPNPAASSLSRNCGWVIACRDRSARAARRRRTLRGSSRARPARPARRTRSAARTRRAPGSGRWCPEAEQHLESPIDALRACDRQPDHGDQRRE